jgi:hypothetical protein
MNDFSDDLANLTEGIEDSRRTAELLGLLASDLIGLAGLEFKLFGHTLVALSVLAAMMLLMLAGGWLFLTAAVAVALTSMQAFSVVGALLTVAALHLLLLGLMLWRTTFLNRDLTFRATRSSFLDLATRMKNPSSAAVQHPEGT